MTYSKFYQFIDRLHEMTLRNKVQWEDTSLEDTYQANFPKYSVRIKRKAQPRDEDDFKISIFNEDGEAVEEFWDAELSRSAQSNYFTILRDIFETARRQALGTEEALDELLSALEDDDDLPF